MCGPFWGRGGVYEVTSPIIPIWQSVITLISYSIEICHGVIYNPIKIVNNITRNKYIIIYYVTINTIIKITRELKNNMGQFNSKNQIYYTKYSYIFK